MTVLLGLTVEPRPATPADALALATIRATPRSSSVGVGLTT
jgi:hypothetical protein